MPRPIVVEGPDGSGKTTLCDALCKRMDRVYHHSGGAPSNRLDVEVKLNRIIEQVRASPLCILDRHPAISDPIYSRTAARPLYYPAHLLMEELKAIDPVIIYCRRKSLADMWKSVQRTQKPHKSPEHLRTVLENYKEVVDMYDEFFSRNPSGLLVFRYDWGSEPSTSLIRDLRRCAD